MQNVNTHNPTTTITKSKLCLCIFVLMFTWLAGAQRAGCQWGWCQVQSLASLWQLLCLWSSRFRWYYCTYSIICNCYLCSRQCLLQRRCNQHVETAVHWWHSCQEQQLSTEEPVRNYTTILFMHANIYMHAQWWTTCIIIYVNAGLSKGS